MIEEKKGFLTFIIHKIVVYLNIFSILYNTILCIKDSVLHLSYVNPKQRFRCRAGNTGPAVPLAAPGFRAQSCVRVPKP